MYYNLCCTNRNVRIITLYISAEPKQSLSEAKEHKKIIEKGVPEDVTPGVKHRNDPLPAQSLSGLVNKYGSKVRLFFKKDLDQLWIGTKGWWTLGGVTCVLASHCIRREVILAVL